MSVINLAKQSPGALKERFLELGSTGLNQWSGILSDEFLRELRGPNGVKVYREMAKNDAMVGASLFAYETLAKGVTFTVQSASPGDAQADEVAEFVSGALFEDMNLSWRDLLGEILSFLTYGWAAFERVYKRRNGAQALQGQPTSRFNDNRLGWRKWAIRGQDTLVRWIIDDAGGIGGFIQRAAPRFEEVELPIDRLLLFRTKIERGSPEGVSILRSAYPTFYQKRRIQVVRGIGIERDLAGLPVLTPPAGVDIWNTNDPTATSKRTEGEKVVRNIKRDQHEGILKPNGWILELLSSGGGRQFDITDVIAQLNSEIAMSMMTDFLLVGHEKVGSRSVASDKRSVFSHAAGSFLDSICDVINRFAIPDLVRLNGWAQELAPTLQHGPVAEIELSELVTFVKETAAAGLIFPDEELERHLRERAHLPPPPDREAPPEGESEPTIEEPPVEKRAPITARVPVVAVDSPQVLPAVTTLQQAVADVQATVSGISARLAQPPLIPSTMTVRHLEPGKGTPAFVEKVFERDESGRVARIIETSEFGTIIKSVERDAQQRIVRVIEEEQQ